MATVITGTSDTNATFVGNDRLLFGMILGVLAFWLFAQTTLNICADHGGRSGNPDERDEHRRVDHGTVLGHLHRRHGRARRSSRTGEGRAVGLRPQHRRLAPGRSGAVGGTGISLSDAGPHLPGALGRLHHARESGARESLLGRCGAPARCQPVVHGVVGRLGLRRALRRPDGGKRRLALDLLRVRGGVGDRHAHGARHPGEQGGSHTCATSSTPPAF